MSDLPFAHSQSLYFDCRGVPVQRHASIVAEQVLAFSERLLACVILWALLPGLALAACIVALLSRRSPFVAHARVGIGATDIWVLKLRTMWGAAAPPQGGSGWFIERLRGESVPEVKPACDPRVTSRFASVCRKYSIDELPQLWQVVRGELSMVGPRPMTRAELLTYYGSAAREVLAVKPGLTGLWQVRGRSSLNYRQRRRLDLFFVRHRSVRLCMRILLATVPRVLSGRDAC